MKILISATYFEPYHSGLSTYAFRLAQGLTVLGHDVVVLTSAYDKKLALEEKMSGFRVVRVPVTLRLSKGVVMLSLPRIANIWLAWADVVNLHLPQFESAFLAESARRLGKPVVTTWHCDLEMNGVLLGKLAGWATNAAGKKTLSNSKAVVQNSLDYARSSKYLSQYLAKVVEVETPIELKSVERETIEGLRKRLKIEPGTKLIGLAGRVAREKGYEYLAAALPIIWAEMPNVRVVHAGMWQGVVGEQDYQRSIERLIQPFGDKWVTLGFLSDEEFIAFFALIDVLAFSSLNRTESFGIVQVEALAQGTPIVTSDLPGVRQPVLQTGMGEIVPLRDPEALAKGILSILKADTRKRTPEAYLQSFAIPQVARKYETIFKNVLADEIINPSSN
ncbi:MAG: glycosyltransferase family 4 protein [Anaerolineaceae bacterium]